MNTEKAITDHSTKTSNLDKIKGTIGILALSALGLYLLEDFYSGPRAAVLCHEWKTAVSERVAVFQAAAKEQNSTKIIFEKEFTDKDVNLLLPWSRHKTCRLEIKAP